MRIRALAAFSSRLIEGRPVTTGSVPWRTRPTSGQELDVDPSIGAPLVFSRLRARLAERRRDEPARGDALTDEEGLHTLGALEAELLVVRHRAAWIGAPAQLDAAVLERSGLQADGERVETGLIVSRDAIRVEVKERVLSRTDFTHARHEGEVHRDVALGVVVQNGERGRVDGLREADDRAHRFRLLTGHERETRGERERKGESNRHALVKSKIRTRPLDGSNRWILNGSSLTGRDASLPRFSRHPSVWVSHQTRLREATRRRQHRQARLPGGVGGDLGRRRGIACLALRVDDLDVGDGAGPIRRVGELEGLTGQLRRIARGKKRVVRAAHRLERRANVGARLPETRLVRDLRLVAEGVALPVLTVP